MIKAAKDFVCIRLATYEDSTEAQFVVDRMGREGESLRNFGYALASPGFETLLERSDRGPNFTYGSAAEMAAKLKSISSQFEKVDPEDSLPGLPKMKNVRLAVNVASCDGLPCLVIYGETEAELERLENKMRVVASKEEIAGKLISAATLQKEEVAAPIEGAPETGYLLVQPDAYGLTGKIIAHVVEPDSAEQLSSALLAVVEGYDRLSKTHGQHVRWGRQNGIVWETEVAVPSRDRMRR